MLTQSTAEWGAKGVGLGRYVSLWCFFLLNFSSHSTLISYTGWALVVNNMIFRNTTHNTNRKWVKRDSDWHMRKGYCFCFFLLNFVSHCMLILYKLQAVVVSNTYISKYYDTLMLTVNMSRKIGWHLLQGYRWFFFGNGLDL